MMRARRKLQVHLARHLHSGTGRAVNELPTASGLPTPGCCSQAPPGLTADVLPLDDQLTQGAAAALGSRAREVRRRWGMQQFSRSKLVDRPQGWTSSNQP